MTGGRGAKPLTAEDLTAAPLGSFLPGRTSNIVKQPGGTWRRVSKADGSYIGSTMTADSVASFLFLRGELKPPAAEVKR